MNSNSGPARVERRTFLKENCVVFCAVLLCFFQFLSIFYLSHRKFLCLDCTHFDLQDFMRFVSLFRAGGFSGMLVEYPYFFFIITQEVSLLVGFGATLLLKSTYTIFFLQALYLSVGLFLGFLIVRNMTKNGWAALAAMSALALNPYLWCFFTLGTRSALLSVPCFMAFLYCIIREKNGAALIFIVLTALCKMTLLFSCAILGLILFLVPPRRRIGLDIFLTCILTFCAFLILSSLVANRLDIAVTPEMMHIQAFGQTISEAVRTILTQPILVLKQVLSKANLGLLVLLASFLFLPLLGGRFFFGMFPDFFSHSAFFHEYCGRRSLQKTLPGDFQPPGVLS